jgi:hypothetical protein
MVFSGTVASDFLKLLPSELDNKEKLLDYSAADFNSFRQTLINYIKATFPLDYSNFSESDFGMFLIELMAAVGHIQSYKSDYLANENYIKTARSRASVKKLLELIGVRMKGPISAAANARIRIDTDLNPSSVNILPQDRVITITSPEDGGSLTYTLYKVRSDGTVDLDSNTTDLTFSVSASNGVVFISDAVLLEGALVVDSGDFRSPDTIKTVALSQSPYVERSAQVYIEGSPRTTGVYSEEENLYFASGAEDKVFQVVTDDAFNATVVFGDSSIGLSPAVGDTYTISYRVGGGSRGNIAREVINAPINLTVTNGSTSTSIQGILENTSQGTGGADAESIAHAKRYAPLTFRRQDRLVTLQDYKSFANTFMTNYGSTGKANAIVRRAYSSANIIDLFVLEKASNTQLRKATPEYKKQLLEAISEKKMLTDEPVVVDGLIRTLDIILTVNLDQKYKKFESELRAKVRQKVLEFFDVDNSDFGEEFIPQDLIKYILDLSEIRFVTVDNVENRVKIDFNEIIQLNNLTINTAYI